MATENGIIEQDAAIMSGQTGMGASAACLKEAENPILAAKSVMEQHGSYKFLADDEGVKEFLGYSHKNPHDLKLVKNKKNIFSNLGNQKIPPPKNTC